MLPTLLVLTAAMAQEAPPVVNGELTDYLNPVGALLRCNEEGCSGSFCSGTLVEPQWVLTAAHCLDDSDDGSGRIIAFGLGPREGSVTEHEVLQWILHPEYEEGNGAYQDIALIQLKKPVEDVVPMPVRTKELNDFHIGDDLWLVGFGVTGSETGDGGTKRWADLPLVAIDDHAVYMYDEEEGQSVCYGDSGGATLLPLDKEGTFELVAVNSQVWGQSSEVGPCEDGMSVSTHVAGELGFVSSYVQLKSYEEAVADGSVPEDHVWWYPEEEEGDLSGGGGGGVANPEYAYSPEDTTSGACATAAAGASGALWLLGALGLGLRRRD